MRREGCACVVEEMGEGAICPQGVLSSPTITETRMRFCLFVLRRVTRFWYHGWERKVLEEVTAHNSSGPCGKSQSFDTLNPLLALLNPPAVTGAIAVVGHVVYNERTLVPQWVSKASARQRRGRAGRTKAGVCFHLFSARRHESLRDFQESELLRTPLEASTSTVVKVDRPPEKVIVRMGNVWQTKYKYGAVPFGFPDF